MKGQRQPAAVVLVNLGTPEAATPKAVRKFLREFLSDPRVVEIPRILWLIILNLFVLPFRPAKVAEAYKLVWTDRGSPIRWITEDQVTGLSNRLSQRYSESPPTVRYAMTYGEPSISGALNALYETGHRRVLVLPMYPQYSGSTTGAVYDQIADYVKTKRALPGLSVINSYFYKEPFIDALCQSIEDFWQEEGRGDYLLFSYHGIPKSYVEAGDPYAGQCECTTAAVSQKLNLDESTSRMTYQSRFGKAEWLTPYTDKTIEELGHQGVETLDVVCPAFSADCLETLEEIAEQNREIFEEAGGKRLRLIPCLNASKAHIDALDQIISPYLDGMV